MRYSFYFFIPLLSLLCLCNSSEAANQALNKPKVLLPKSENWSPYYFKDKDTQYQGTDLELLRTVLKQMAISLEIVDSVPRKRFFDPKHEYNHNALFAVTYRQEREKQYYFSKPYRIEQIGIFSLKPSIAKLTNVQQLLTSEYLGIMNQAAYFGATFNQLKQKYPDKLIHAENTKQQIALLLKGRGDYIIGDAQHHKAVLSAHTTKPIFQSNFYISEHPVHFIFLKTDFSAEFMRKFDTILQQQLRLNRKH